MGLIVTNDMLREDMVEVIQKQAAEIDALKQAVRDYKTFTDGVHCGGRFAVAEELERLADSTEELREMFLTKPNMGLRAFSHAALASGLRARAAELREQSKAELRRRYDTNNM